MPRMIGERTMLLKGSFDSGGQQRAASAQDDKWKIARRKLIERAASLPPSDN
jgi:hypothetical protein